MKNQKKSTCYVGFLIPKKERIYSRKGHIIYSINLIVLLYVVKWIMCQRGFFTSELKRIIFMIHIFFFFCRNTFPITSPRTTSWLDSHPKNPIHLEKNLPATLSKNTNIFTSFSYWREKMKKTHKTRKKQKNNMNRINAHIDFFFCSTQKPLFVFLFVLYSSFLK